MRVRTLTIIIGLMLFIPIFVHGGNLFTAFIILMALITLYEFLRILGRDILSIENLITLLLMLSCLIPEDVLSIFNYNGYIDQMTVYYALCMLLMTVMVYKSQVRFDHVATLMVAALYVGRGYQFLILGRQIGIMSMVYVFSIIWGSDTFAYLGGRFFGKHKLAPKISPNKTIEGSICGMGGAFLLSSIFLFFHNIYNLSFLQNLLIVVVLSFIGQMGDLVESAIKRQYQVKDSGKILPGHGGLLDRFDSTLFALPMFHFLISLFSF